jgi:SDR family mycofactocin-dependent oxidoreductase
MRLAEEGADIIGIDFQGELESTVYPAATAADLQETAAAVEAHDRRVVTADADVRDRAELARAVNRCVAEVGPPDIVVANAGIFSVGLLCELTGTDWDEMIDINLTGVFNTMAAVIGHITDGASLVITSSVLGLQGVAGASHYAAAKHGVVGLMRSLAAELGHRSIRVNAVLPGTVPTDMVMNDHTFSLFSPDKEHPSVEDFREASTASHLLPVPWVESRDISNAILFLASDEARYITGETLLVDAGFSKK